MKFVSPNAVGFTATIPELNRLICRNLADEYIIYLTTRDYFWNVTGSDLLCLMFEELNDASEVRLELFAERATSGMCGDGWINNSANEAPRLHFSHGMGMPAEEMVSRIVALHESAIRLIHADIESCNSLAQGGTADFLAGIARAHERTTELLHKILVVGLASTR